MRRYFRVIRLYFRLGVLNELEYRANFFVEIFQSALSLVVGLGGIAIVFDHTSTLNGWLPAQLLAVIGVYFIIGALIRIVIQPSMQRFMEDVRQGTLDYTLLKPADAQLLVSVRQVQIWKTVDLVVGAVVLGAAVVQMAAQISLLQALSFVLTLLAGAAIVYSFWLMLATVTFWFIKIDNILVIFESMYEAGRWPVGIYPAWLRFALTFFVPVAFAVTVPAEALIGQLTQEALLLALGLAAAMLVASRLFWLRGIRSYSGASA